MHRNTKYYELPSGKRAINGNSEGGQILNLTKILKKTIMYTFGELKQSSMMIIYHQIQNAKNEKNYKSDLWLHT